VCILEPFLFVLFLGFNCDLSVILLPAIDLVNKEEIIVTEKVTNYICMASLNQA